ncbi:hypothetical protein F0562_013375 [Nyssa sinensis]|uniref:Uncharacterized protein n=1 Tax=Nyssa sinensis TaxID=561372 RepID=A0A5J4ZQ25_9ASTE|nr:hypothetical protein F0562_013375 [Nyssa sinensis]
MGVMVRVSGGSSVVMVDAVGLWVMEDGGAVQVVMELSGGVVVVMVGQWRREIRRLLWGMMGLVSVMELRLGVGVEAAMLMEDGGATVVMEDTVVTVGSDGMRDDGVPGLKLCGRQLWRCGGAMKQVRAVRW